MKKNQMIEQVRSIFGNWYSAEAIKRVHARMPIVLVKAFRAQGWTVMDVYEIVKQELYRERRKTGL